MTLLTNYVGKPVIALRNKIWHMVAGTTLDVDTQDLLLQFSQSGEGSALLGGGKQ